jgi:integrase
MRVGQALGLRWADIDLENGFITFRISVRGAKGGRTRTVPMHSALIREMSGWPRVGRNVVCKANGSPWRNDATLEPMRLAWELSGVDRAVWDHVDEADARDDDRVNGRPNHAFRAAVRTELEANGVTKENCDLLLGHGQGFVETYVSSRFSPKMPALKAAIELLPVHSAIPDKPPRTTRPKA